MSLALINRRSIEKVAKIKKVTKELRARAYLVEKRVRNDAQRYKFFSKGDVIFICSSVLNKNVLNNLLSGKEEKSGGKESVNYPCESDNFSIVKLRVAESLVGRITGPMGVKVAGSFSPSVTKVVSTATLDDEIEHFLGVLINSEDKKMLKNVLKASNIRNISGSEIINPAIIHSETNPLRSSPSVSSSIRVKRIPLLQSLTNEDVVVYALANSLCANQNNACNKNKWNELNNSCKGLTVPKSQAGLIIDSLDKKYPGRRYALYSSVNKLRRVVFNNNL